RRHTRFSRDWSSDVCSSDLLAARLGALGWIEEDLGARLAAEPAALGEALRAAARAVALALAGLAGEGEELLELVDHQHEGVPGRSEERRVGKECRAGTSAGV